MNGFLFFLYAQMILCPNEYINCDVPEFPEHRSFSNYILIRNVVLVKPLYIAEILAVG